VRWLFNLSFRHKIPLWTSFLIGFSIFVVGAALMTRAYQDMKAAVIISADNLGHTLANTVAPMLLHDDVWRAFEIVRSPIRADSARSPAQVDAVVVFGRDRRVFVSSHPESLPMLSEAAALGGDWQALAARLETRAPVAWPLVIEPEGSTYLYLALPITDKDAQLGHLVLRYAKSVFHPWFVATIWQGLGLGLLVLAVLIPINWYWGSRMASPLVDLAQRMGTMPRQVPEPLSPEIYPYADELGQLFQAYDRMVLALREKAALENEVVRSERLAAIGQLTAGIAHEINNPLAGLITAVDTLKLSRDLDARAVRHLDLIDRGLMQIRDTVAALLVQTRVQARPLSQHDLDDVRTLIQPQVAKRRIALDWSDSMPRRTPGARQPGATNPDQPAVECRAGRRRGRAGQPVAGAQGRIRQLPGHRRAQRRHAAQRRATGAPVRTLCLDAAGRPRPRPVGHLPDRHPAQRPHHRAQCRGPCRIRRQPASRRYAMQHRIGLIEDDSIIGEALSERLEFEGFACDWYRDAKSARRGLAQRRYSVVVSDINLPDSSGEALFGELAGSGQALAPFIFITGYGAVDQAVRLLKLGAQDYVTKPFDVGELIAKIRALCERLQPMTDVASTLGISAGMRQIEGLLPRLAASRSAVLISGESGAGKEEVARALHRIGDPTGKTPFVAVNCGAIPENLIESELFGHDKGAFTGAERERKGVFEQADGGTLFPRRESARCRRPCRSSCCARSRTAPSSMSAAPPDARSTSAWSAPPTTT
jgi:FixJ family two-component response regulator/signal transduction histidine kinase